MSQARIRELIRTFGIVMRNAFIGGNLASLTQITNPKQMAKYTSECLFHYKTLFGKRGIPQKRVYEILPTKDVEDIKLGSLISGRTWFSTFSSNANDIVNLCMICQICKPLIVFEIGTMRGYTSFHFALNTPDDAKIYTLDLPKNQEVKSSLKTTAFDVNHIKSHEKSEQYCFNNNDAASKIELLFGDSANYDFSPFFEKVDFFFIDGAHSYEYVRSDTLNAFKCCHPGSIIAWHDFGRVGVNGVTKWILEISEKGHDIYAIPGGSLAFMVVRENQF